MQQTNRSGNKIMTHYGIREYYDYYCKHSSTTVDKKTYVKILDDFNAGLIELILDKGIVYTTPSLGFELCIRKVKREPRIKDGKLINSVPVDYKATNELWAIDPEAKEKKILVRYRNTHSNKHIFYIRMIKTNYKYKNKKYYSFKPSRAFQRSLAKRIKDDNKDPFETFLLY